MDTGTRPGTVTMRVRFAPPRLKLHSIQILESTARGLNYYRYKSHSEFNKHVQDVLTWAGSSDENLPEQQQGATSNAGPK